MLRCALYSRLPNQVAPGGGPASFSARGACLEHASPEVHSKIINPSFRLSGDRCVSQSCELQP